MLGDGVRKIEKFKIACRDIYDNAGGKNAADNK
jgi:hypothetical protein